MPQNEKNAKPIGGPGGRGGHGPRPNVKNPGKLFMRLLSYIMKNYAVHCVIVVICIFITVLASVQGTWFMQTLIDGYILPLMKQSDPDFSGLAHAILRVAVFYGIGIAQYKHILCGGIGVFLGKNVVVTKCRLFQSLPVSGVHRVDRGGAGGKTADFQRDISSCVIRHDCR